MKYYLVSFFTSFYRVFNKQNFCTQFIYYGLILIASLGSVACESKVGDPCVTSTQCAPGQICDIKSKEGYCTLRDCEDDICPSGSICVTFENLDRYCMATCQTTDDCRDGYMCDTEISTEPICRQAP